MSQKLEEYNEKRNFEKSLEPEGSMEESDEILRFGFPDFITCSFLLVYYLPFYMVILFILWF